MLISRLGAVLSATAVVAAGCGDSRVEGGDGYGSSAAALGNWGVIELGPGYDPSLALDDKGMPAVSLVHGVPDPFSDSGDSTATVFTNDGRWRSGTGWSSSSLPSVPGYRLGDQNSLALPAGKPQLVFSSRDRLDPSNEVHLKLATPGHMGWQITTLEDQGATFQSVQRSAGTDTWVVYQDPAARQTGVRVATSWSGQWETHDVAIPHSLLNSIDAAVSDPTLAKPAVGIATTTLSANGAGDPKGLHFVGSPDGGTTWNPVVHIDDKWGMIGPQIAYTGLNPLITYTELDQHHAKFAYSIDGGLSFSVETIGTFDANPATGLAVDPRNGQPVVAIVSQDLTNAEARLHVARRVSPGNWSLELVDSVPMVDNQGFTVNPRIAVTPDGTVAIAYTHRVSDERRVRFAWNDRQIVIEPPKAN